jgi:hypothetical protein
MLQSKERKKERKKEMKMEKRKEFCVSRKQKQK